MRSTLTLLLASTFLTSTAIADTTAFRLQIPDGVFISQPSGSPSGNGGNQNGGGNAGGETPQIPSTFSVALQNSIPPYATVGDIYNNPIIFNGGTGPYATSYSGTIPNGLSISGGNLAGTFYSPGSYSFNLTSEDANHRTGTSQNYSLDVHAQLSSSYSKYNIISNIGATNNISSSISGGLAPYGYAVNPTTSGVSIDPSNGTLTYLSSEDVSNLAFQVTVNDSVGRTRTHSFTVDNAAALSISYPGWINTNTAGNLYTGVPPTTTGGRPPYSYSLTTSSSGLSINSESGVVSYQNENQNLSVPVNIRVTDSKSRTANSNLSITNYAALAFNYPGWTGAATTGITFTGTTPTVTGGATPYTYSLITPAAGLSIDSDTGVVSYTSSTQNLNIPVNIKITDANNNSATQSLSIQNANALIINYPNWSGIATAGTLLSEPAPTVSGGVGPYTYNFTSTIPGSSITTATGAITYRNSTTNLNVVLTVRVTDSQNRTATTSVVVQNAAPILTTYPTAQFTQNEPTTLTPTVSGGSGNRTFTLSGTIPPGISINSSNGIISGTTTATGTSGTMTVTTRDSNGRTSQTTVPWTTVPQFKVFVAMVGGGGAGGARQSSNTTEYITGGGGGGSGEVWVSNGYSVPVKSGTNYPIKVGAGMSASSFSTTTAAGSSSAFGKTAVGGGRGFGTISTSSLFITATGGGGAHSTTSTILTPGANVNNLSGVSYYNAGGTSPSRGPAGGGGPATAGGSPASGYGGGKGGDYTNVPLGGNTAPYVRLGGGGAGGASQGYPYTYNLSPGSATGGGAGGPQQTAGSAGTVPGAGGGGGGGSIGVKVLGGNGAKGVVYIVYPGTSALATGGTITIENNKVIHKFESDGNFKLN